MNLLKNRENINNPGIAEFLRKSQCGMKVNSHQVCCELIDIDFGTVNELEGPVTTYFYGESIWIIHALYIKLYLHFLNNENILLIDISKY